MNKDVRDVVFSPSSKQIAYYNLPRGKQSARIKYMLRWRKWASRY